MEGRSEGETKRFKLLLSYGVYELRGYDNEVKLMIGF